MGHKGIPEREVHSNTPYLKKIETFQINNLTLPLKELEKQQQTKPRVRSRKKSKSFWKQIKMKHSKTYGTQGRQF